jgi:potassium-dependent mechanosensitive channel
MRGRNILKLSFWLMCLFKVVLVVALAGAFFLVSLGSGETADQQTPVAQGTPAPQSIAGIPLTDVATKTTEVSSLLRTLNMELAPSPDIERIGRQLSEVSGRIGHELSGTMNLLKAQPTLAMIQSQNQVWQSRQLEITAWLNLLTLRATHLQEALDQLTGLQKTWSQTQESAMGSKAPGPIMQQIEGTLAAIGAAQTVFQTQRTDLLDLQSRVGQEVARCQTALAEISQAQKKAMGGLLTRDSRPVWSTALWIQAHTVGLSRVREIVAGQWGDIEQYIKDPSKGMPLHIGLFILLAILLCLMRRQVRRWPDSTEDPSQAITVFDWPYSAALLGTLFAATSPNLPTPPTVRQLFSILELVPMIRLTKPVVNPLIIPGLYVLAGLFTLNMVREAFAGAPLIEQGVILIEIVTAIAALWWALTLGNRAGSDGRGKSLARLPSYRSGATPALLMLAVGLVAGTLGYLRLARLLTSTVVAGSVLALALFAYARVILGGLSFVLRVWPLRLLQMVRHHSSMLEKRIYRFLIWLAVVAWLTRVLDYVGLFGPVLSLGKTVLAARLERGSISISVEDVLAFFVTVWVSYLLSAFLRFVLQEDIYPRMRMQRGLSYAISSLLNYVLLALGVVVGMGMLGVNLSRVTVLAGAFGVGIGFGLQSIVNNFVSGLILLFERPVHVGDTVEIGNLQGEVKRIGIRSSVVRTSVGSDIIVPNSQLVTEQVTNWTLSDRLRRIDLSVGVNYGAEPGKVIELLEQVAAAHPDVLQTPPPRAFFTGFGDSSISFELRVWTGDFDKWYQIRSELAVAVYDAGYKAGLSFPFPQREVRLLRDHVASLGRVDRAEGLQSPPAEERAKTVAGEKEEPDSCSGT